MNLKKLQSLSETLQITEGKVTKTFDGINNVVNDALADLVDKIGKGGNLDELFKSSGANKLDTVKDKEGNNILKALAVKTAAYKKEVERLMMEAEMLASQVDESTVPQGRLIKEGKDYSDSSEFTDEFYTLLSDVAKMLKVMKNPRWKTWLKTTDTNFGVETVSHGEDAISSASNLQKALIAIDTEFDNL